MKEADEIELIGLEIKGKLVYDITTAMVKKRITIKMLAKEMKVSVTRINKLLDASDMSTDMVLISGCSIALGTTLTVGLQKKPIRTGSMA